MSVEVGQQSAGRPGTTAYVVLSHALPDQVSRLCGAIHRSSPRAQVVVHHDDRGCPPPQALGAWMRVHSHHRQANWGSWELAAESIHALELARERTNAELLVLVSGQDYPVVPLERWERKFSVGGGGWQGEAFPLHYRPRWGRSQGQGDDDLTRYTHLWWALPGGRRLSEDAGRGAVLARRALFRVGHYAEPLIDVRNLARGRGMHIGLRNPVPPFNQRVRCVKGSQWLAVEATLLDTALQAHRDHHWLRWSYRHSVIPDESYLQTLLATLRQPQNAPPISFVDWAVELDRPRTLTLKDLGRVQESGSPFCRKVDPGPSDTLMAELDKASSRRSGGA